MAKVKRREGICGKVWEHAWSGMEPCHLPAGHEYGCAFSTNKCEQEPDALERLSSALAEATIALNVLKKGGLDCD